MLTCGKSKVFEKFYTEKHFQQYFQLISAIAEQSWYSKVYHSYFILQTWVYFTREKFQL
jgi:hypothetical protein